MQEESASWRTHIERLLQEQGERHLHDTDRLQDMLMKLVIGGATLRPMQQPQSSLNVSARSSIRGGDETQQKEEAGSNKDEINRTPATVPVTTTVPGLLFGDGGTKSGANVSHKIIY